jgi:hypothetical protein
MNVNGGPDYLLAGNGAQIPFNSGVPDMNGCYWYMDGEMVGWDSPDGRVSMLTKIGNGPNADGEYPADNHYRGRTVTFTLMASCPSEATRQEARYLMAQVLDLVDSTGNLFVNEEVPKVITISRSGNSNQGKLVLTDSGTSGPAPSTPGFPTAQPDAKGQIYILKADVEVYATDPRKYSNPFAGPVPILANAVTLDNLGNTDTTNWFCDIIGGVIGSSGPLNLVLTNGLVVQTMTLRVPALPFGAPALSPFPTQIGINFLENTIRDGLGNSIYYLRDLTTPWLVLLPGENVLTFTGPDVVGIDGECTWNSAWI